MGAFRLRVIAGAATGAEIPINGEFLIGRGESGAGNLQGDREISRRHARVYPGEGGALVVEDLGSTNGTKVNDRAITGPRVIRPGDRIAIGETNRPSHGRGARSRPSPRRLRRLPRHRAPRLRSLRRSPPRARRSGALPAPAVLAGSRQRSFR
jgi:pSer/pThr/pTyr-binding forkhead associated (FHA) protein